MEDESVEVKNISLDKIHLAPEVQIRTGINKRKVTEYSDMIGEGIHLDPITVVMDDQGRYIVADGFHRYSAYLERGLTKIPTIIFQCHPSEAVSVALEISCARNSKHGLQLSPKDKRHAAALLLRDPMHSKKNDRPLAKMIGVSSALIKSVREELYAPPEKPSRPEAPKATSKSSTSAPAEVVDDEDIQRERVKTFTRWVMDEDITWQHVVKAFSNRQFTPTMIPVFPCKLQIRKPDGHLIGVMVDELNVIRKEDGVAIIRVHGAREEEVLGG